MKKYIIIIAIIQMMVHISCDEDFLYQTDPTRIASEEFYSTESQFIQAVNGVYAQLQSSIIPGQYMFNELIADNTTVDFWPDSRSSAIHQEAFEFWTLNPSTTDIQSMYENYYNIIYDINLPLAKLQDNEEISDAVKNECEGQLKFFRAYSYFQLTQYFGDLVLLTEPLDAPSQAWEYVREPQSSVYTQIESDLNDAVSLLPASYGGENIGRITKGAALTLLGKVYLTQKKYSDAVTTLKDVLPLGYSLLSNYEDIFDPANKNHKESIFEIQYQGGNDLGEHSNFAYTFSPRFSGEEIIGHAQATPGGWNIPTNDMIAAYEEGDLRKDASIGLDFTSPRTDLIVPYIKKYVHGHSIYGRTDDNWPVLRYADVLLMLAEAINEQSGPTSEAYGYLNEVRERAGLDPLSDLNKESFREKVLHERRIELAFENWRWFDLRRTKTPSELTAFLNAYGQQEKENPTVSRQGLPFNPYDFKFDEHEVLLPIPQSEILINDKIIQNPEY